MLTASSMVAAICTPASGLAFWAEAAMLAAFAPLWRAAVQMMVLNDGASKATISSALLSKEVPTTRIQLSAPCIALRLASDWRMPSGVWPTSITVRGSC